MQANQAAFPLRTMARVLQVSSSGYHDWRSRVPSARQQANARLLEQIRAVHQTSDGSYGVPRVTAQLRQDGVLVNHKRVERLMRQQGLAGVSRRRAWCVTDLPPSGVPIELRKSGIVTLTQARHEVFTWIETWYNPRRLHSALGYRSPNAFESQRPQPELPTVGACVACATPPVDNSATAGSHA